jgi:circadian clock protein KaiC
MEQRRLFSFFYVSPVELSTDAFLDRARQLVEQVGARRAVLDSLTSLALGVPSQRRFKELVYAMTKHFRALGVTLNMNMEVAELLGSAQLSGHGISFAADNVIQLKYLEQDGRLDRGISVLKARGIRHATEVRRLNVEDRGVEVGAPFKGLRGVLTGLPTPTGG